MFSYRGAVFFCMDHRFVNIVVRPTPEQEQYNYNIAGAYS